MNFKILKNRNRLADYLVVAAFLIFVFFISTIKLFLDDDTFWHLATGRFIIQNGYIQSTDVFGYLTLGNLWIPFEWFWDVITYLMYNIAGFYSLSIFRSLIVISLFVLIFITLRRDNVSYPVIILASILLSFGVMLKFSIRPQVISFFFLSLILYLLFNYKQIINIKKILVIFPLIFLLWANMHMGVLLGISVFLVFVISREISFYRLEKKKKTNDEILNNKYLLYSFLLSIIALLINPHFFNTYLYTLQQSRMDLLKDIAEWRSPFTTTALSYYYVKIYLFFLITGVITIYYAVKTKNIFPALLYIIFGIYSTQGIRFIFDFMVIIFIPWMISLDYIFQKVKTSSILIGGALLSMLYLFVGYSAQVIRFSESLILVLIGWIIIIVYLFLKNKPKISREYIVKAALGIILIFLIITSSNNTLYTDFLGNNFHETGFGVNEKFFPKAMFDFIAKENINKIGTRPFNNLLIGGYFVWNFPESKNFIDSRNLNDNIYFKYKSIDFMWRNYEKMTFEKTIDTLGIDYFIYSTPYLLGNVYDLNKIVVSYLSTARDKWKLIYWDDRSFLFVRNVPKFADVISKYEYKYITPYNILFDHNFIDDNFQTNSAVIDREVSRKRHEEPNGMLINYVPSKRMEMIPVPSK